MYYIIIDNLILFKFHYLMKMADTIYSIQEMIDKIKSVKTSTDSRLDGIEKSVQEKKTLTTSDVTYLRKQIAILTSGKGKYKELAREESKKILNASGEIREIISDEILYKTCVRCGTNLLKKQVVKHRAQSSWGSTFSLSKRQRRSFKENIRAHLERFVKHDLSKKVCDACYHEIIYDTKVYNVHCIEFSNNKQDVDGYICFQNFDEQKLIFGDKKGRDFITIPVHAITSYEILFKDKLSNYRKLRDDLSFVLFNRSEKEKQERKLSSDLNSIDTKLTELLRIDFTDSSIANRIVLECDDLNNLYSAIENICKNKIE